jgi:hypothetical protein
MKVDTMKILGSHGTPRSNKTIIEEQGFNRGKEGRIGSGVYLWSNGTGYGYELARAWVIQRYKSKFHNEKKGSVLFCSTSINESEIVDIETEELKAAIAEIAEKSGSDDACAIHNLFIQEYEKLRGNPVKVIKGRVFPPSEDCFLGCGRIYKAKILGSPICYAIRDEKLVIVESSIDFEF